MNVFEGARRIAYLTAAGWAVGTAIVVLYVDEPVVRTEYLISSPNISPIRADENSCGDDDRQEWDYRQTASGTKVRIIFCFKAQRFDGGKMYVPYRIDGKGMWGNERYSSDVREYAERRLRDFSMPKADQQWANDQYWPLRLQQLYTASRWIIGGWLALWFFTSAVGWVVRGFAGIPTGQDRKVH